ncbi:MAG: four helix bundle protein [Bacteroidota bacterium]
MEPQDTYRGFKELNCWKEGRALRKQISKLTKTFPASEKFQLTSQMIRASRSITNNIAEGYGRYTYTDTRHFFIQARGSASELIDHITIALDEEYISEETTAVFEKHCETVFKLINGYIAYLDKSKNSK